MQKRIFRGALLLTLATALVIGLLSAAVYYHRSGEQLESQLWQELDMLSTLMEQSADQDAEEAALKALTMPNRLTWIAPDGTVRYDNQSNAASMENHLGREEIAQASETGTGFSRRFSQTLLEEQLYCAKKLDDGSYLRVAATQSSLAGSLWRMGGALVAGIAVVLIAAAVLSRLWTRSLVRPINEINLENPLQNRVYDELTPMLRRMAEQNRRLETQMREIDARRGELETIIGHMNEGLLILDAHRHVLLMNDSARAILHTGLPADGKTPLSVYNRSQTLLDTVEKAIAEGGAHADMSAGGREYLLTASTVRHNEGLVVLLQDVTERNASEAARKLYQQLLQDTGTDLAANYYDTGYKAYRSGDYETAIENLTKAVSYDETNSEALYALANSYRDNGNKRQAKETYQKVIELFPNTEKATQSQRALDQLDN